MSKEKYLLLMSIILAHVFGLYGLSLTSIDSVQTKEPSVIEVEMVTLQEDKLSKMNPVQEEREPVRPIERSVISQPIVQPSQMVSTAKSVVAAQAPAPVIVAMPHQVVEVPVAVTNQEAQIRPPATQKSVVLSGDLSVNCPVRTAPKYPRISLKMDEQGSVVVRVKLDKQGSIAEAFVKSSSGYKRLDEAAISAVQTWKCHPAMRDNTAVEAYALQPFEFNLEGN